MLFACLDIGSTWTKAAAFAVEGQSVSVLARSARPTTVADLGTGFFSLLDETLRPIVDGDPLPLIRSGAVGLQYSSSAKGGLAVAAIGLVPEVTLEIGKTAAQSAGAKLTQVFSYRLTRRDIADLEAASPDILLLAGGTDGGNSEYVLANAQAIAASNIDCAIVYAGNRAAADEVAEILAGKRLRVVDNLLPNFNEPNPEPAREAIRAIFLETIVKGKGLDRIMRATGAEPVPTPYAVYEYVRAIHEHVPGWQDFMLFDMGGATTDVYSAHREAPQAGTMLRGLPEPEIKRSVEGDLGLRVSAQSTAAVDGPSSAAALAAHGIDAAEFKQHADMLTREPDFLPASAHDRTLDTLLAGLCVGHAAARHVGRWQTVFTPDGEVQVQTGRDLTRTAHIIGSGGWLARAVDFNPTDWFAAHAFDARGRRVLLPGDIDYFRDEEYLFPLLANLARSCPRAAAFAGVARLTTQTTRKPHVPA